MISSKSDFKEFLANDIRATGLAPRNILNSIKDRRYKFYHSLRIAEYYTNCKKTGIGKLLGGLWRFRHSLMCDRFGWTIPINVFDKGLAIPHVGTIVVSGRAKIGQNCRIHTCTNIGYAPSHGIDGTPVIGNNVYIGPGAVIFGPIIIGDNTAIGANAVVNKSFPNGNCTIAGAPAKIISNNTSEGYIIS